jgi:hypothetical protein
MRALTIQQPYSHLICHHHSEIPEGAIQKRVENRTRPTKIRGQIAIHAGMSFKWFQCGDWPVVARKATDVPEMAFGAIVGVADIVHCFDGSSPEGRSWLAHHDHAVGPYMYVLDNVFRLETPVPCAGKQGWWTVPEEIARMVNQFRKIAVPFDIHAERFTDR